MKILIAPDSFKDCLSASEVCENLKLGLSRLISSANIQCIPVADGGEGTVQSLVDGTNGSFLTVDVHHPLMKKVSAQLGILGDGITAILEMATASGLELLSEKERNPWYTSTFGTGELIKAALDKEVKKIIIGIGGSATNDGGAGLACALGARFIDKDGNPIPQGGGALNRLHHIDLTKFDPRVKETEILVACDVSNPLCGENGASFVYGKQKGADESMITQLDNHLSHFASIIQQDLQKDIKTLAGGGAAGGTGAGLAAFCDAELKAGFQIVREALHLDTFIQKADIVITGEGRMDNQTKFGKTPFGVAQVAKKYNKPVIGIAGTLGDKHEELYQFGFDALIPIIHQPMNLATAILEAPKLLQLTGERIARMLQLSHLKT